MIRCRKTQQDFYSVQAKAHTEYDLFRQILFVVFLHIRINDRTYGIGHATPVNSACIGSRRPTGRTSSGIKQITPCMSIASSLCHGENDFITPRLAICKTAVIDTSRQRCVKAGTTCIIICRPQSYSLFLRHNPESVRRRVKYGFPAYILRIPCPRRLVPWIQEYPAVFEITNKPMRETFIQPKTLMRDDSVWMFDALFHRKSSPSRLLSICFP